ncbi:hypothetical protein MKX03_015965, partial [Papaver bracteatum]
MTGHSEMTGDTENVSGLLVQFHKMLDTKFNEHEAKTKKFTLHSIAEALGEKESEI